MVDSVAVAQGYFDAWNSRVAKAIVATLADGGTYSDPASGGPLSGQALEEHAQGLFGAFPDLSFDIVSSAATGDGTVAAQWLMKGTNTGPFGGGPPTGQSIELPGADFITVEGDKIRSVQGYFDQRTFVEQIGLQAIVQPYSIGPFTFGVSVRATTGKLIKPGAISLTWIEVDTDEEAEEVRARGRQITQEMLQMEGHISTTTMVFGRRLHTTTAWENPEAPTQLLKSGAHKEAMDRFFGPGFASSASTMVWLPGRFNGMWVRCPSCDQMAEYDQGEGKCRCGAILPEHPPYW